MLVSVAVALAFVVPVAVPSATKTRVKSALYESPSVDSTARFDSSAATVEQTDSVGPSDSTCSTAAQREVAVVAADQSVCSNSADSAAANSTVEWGSAVADARTAAEAALCDAPRS